MFLHLLMDFTELQCMSCGPLTEYAMGVATQPTQPVNDMA